jgi:hypothetical protein
MYSVTKSYSYYLFEQVLMNQLCDDLRWEFQGVSAKWSQCF